ncbi:MAG: recombinase, partial [Erysipelotrichaceae bacterium]|nr:recombinase [Erysipelotrichaceae bacterium]
SIPTPGEYKAAKGNHTHDISRTGGIWSSSTVLRILDDEQYTGTYIIGKRSVLEVGGNKSRLKDRDKWYIIPDHHPALVSGEVFEQAKQGIRRYSIPNKKQHDYLLKGRIICGCCDHSLSRVMQKTPYYHCRHSDADSSMCCHGMKIGIAELEQLIFEVLQKLVEVSGESGQGAQNIAPTSDSLPEYETQIAAIQDDKMKLYERFLSGEIDIAEYRAQKEVLDVSLTKTKSAHAALMTQAKQAQEHRAEQI